MTAPPPTYVLIPGAGGQAWYWHRLVPELETRGHTVIPVELPAADDSAGLVEYADTVVRAIGNRSELILVAQSLAGFTAPLVAQRMPVGLLILLNAMLPAAGESPGEWWTVTGHQQARIDDAIRRGLPADREFDPIQDFFHDVPADVTAAAMAMGEPRQSGTPFSEPWPLDTWPDVPTRFLQARDDRFFPLEFQRRIVRQRLGIALDVMPGGHLVALSQPHTLAARLEDYRLATLGRTPEP